MEQKEWSASDQHGGERGVTFHELVEENGKWVVKQGGEVVGLPHANRFKAEKARFEANGGEPEMWPGATV